MTDFEPLKNRILKSQKHLGRWARKNNLDAYRVYDQDIPEFAYAIDLYADEAVIYHMGHGSSQTSPDQLIQVVAEALSMAPEKLHYKSRERQAGKSQYKKMGESGQIKKISEGKLQFAVNLSDYLDTGLFLDHRPLRQELLEVCAGKAVLNLFCYTGSLGVAAAKGGGTVTSIDMSNTYLDWARLNFMENDLDPADHRFVRADILEWIKHPKGHYNLIILDPPSFSNSKKMTDVLDISRDHSKLIMPLMGILRQGGRLYFSTNKRKFKLDTEISSAFTVKEITGRTVPQDFRKKPHVCFELSHNLKPAP